MSDTRLTFSITASNSTNSERFVQESHSVSLEAEQVQREQLVKFIQEAFFYSRLTDGKSPVTISFLLSCFHLGSSDK